MPAEPTPEPRRSSGVQNHGCFRGSVVRGGGVRPAVTVKISRDDGNGIRADGNFGNRRREDAGAFIEKKRDRVVRGIRNRDVGKAVLIVVRHRE